jgi:acetylornithine/succinyldiaminopimelate/putrescine aminotransferase
MNEAELRQAYQDFARFVNPLVAGRAQLSGEPYLLTQVKDGKLIDVNGRSYVDLLAGWGTQAFGHRPKAIEDSLRDFLDSDVPSFYPSGISPYSGRLAHCLQEKTGYDAAFFANGGSEAVEAALKLARAATGKPRIAYLQGAYHGCTFGSVAMMHNGPYRDSFAPHLPEFIALPANDIEALKQALSDPKLAAVVVEPVQIEAGVRFLTPEYLAVLCSNTSAEGVLLIADEIQTGLGRCGTLLASMSATWPRQPDVVTLGKALGGGLMPLSAMLTRRDIFQRAYGSLTMADAHASTFSGNALACVAGLAAMRLLNETLLAEITRKGLVLETALQQAIGNHPLGYAIRGRGLLFGIELQTPDHPCYQFDYLGLPELAHQPAMGMLALHQLYKAGFISQVCGHAWQVLRIHPPYLTSDADLQACALALKQALDYLWELQ